MTTINAPVNAGVPGAFSTACSLVAGTWRLAAVAGIVGLLSLGLCGCSAANQQTNAEPGSRPNPEPMGSNMENLIQSVLNKDPAAAMQARKIGPSANQELARLARHADAKVRRIALYCLDETGGSIAARAFAEAVLDEDSQVRGAALRGLNHHYGQASPADLLRAYDLSQDPYARQKLMLVIAQFKAGVDVAQVKTRYDKEPDPEAQEGGLAALAQFNYQGARKEFAQRMEASSGKTRLRYLGYCETLREPWLIKPLSTLLRDTGPAVRVGTDARPDLIDTLRVCDVALNLIASISGHTFSFGVDNATNYSAKQIQEVTDFARALPQ